MDPPPGKWLYFVAIDKEGRLGLRRHTSEHERNEAEARACRNGVLMRVTVARACGRVLGKPIAHSLSPVIHNAGYAAAGLTGWSYTAIECAEAELPGLVAGLGPEWAGLSLTMPLKEVALAVAAEVSPVAAALGAANTLVRRPDGGWYADNTDVAGMVDALTDAGVPTGRAGDGAGRGRHRPRGRGRRRAARRRPR